jgi:putative redox protein
MAKATVRLGSEGYLAEIINRNHVTHADEPLTDGGTDTAPTPMEMMLGALGACMAITTQMYARRKGWPLEHVEIALDVERFTAGNYPKYEGDAQFVHEIRNQITFRGALTDEQRERLFEIAGKCPVHRVLANPTFFVEELIQAEIAVTASE